MCKNCSKSTCSCKRDQPKYQVGQVWRTNFKQQVVRIICVDRKDTLPIVGCYRNLANTTEGVVCIGADGTFGSESYLTELYKEPKQYTVKIVLFDAAKADPYDVDQVSAFLYCEQYHKNSAGLVALKTITFTENEGLEDK